jgi:nicotinamidase-related amidase
MSKPSSNPATATAPFRDSPRGGTALVIVDMLTDMDFRGASAMQQEARAAAEVIATLRDAVDAAGLPVIYINDNYGEWHSERSRLVDRALASEGAREFVVKLIPREQDYFVIKPQFSGFYATNLPVLLPKLGVDSLILTGISADICVLFTAADAHMRDYRLWVPQDAVAAETVERRDWALGIMKNAMGAEIRPAAKLKLSAWAKGKRSSRRRSG